MNGKNNCAAYDLWTSLHNAPYHFPMDVDTWYYSMHEDVDSEGRKLFDKLIIRYSPTENRCRVEFNGMISYAITAFGFDAAGELSDQVHHPVIRDLCFEPSALDVGQKLLDAALEDLGREERIYAFFHYFGMSACARHGKLHESQDHIHKLLLNNGFCIEHENVYFSRNLDGTEEASDIKIQWRDRNKGNCREFAALDQGKEVGWGQVHFLPQGDIAYLRWIYIDENLQHQGYGTRVMHSLFCELRTMGIRRFDTDTALINTTAQGYYEKCGFTSEGITRSYYMG